MSARQKARVLVVDDDRLFREILAESLREVGHAVDTARDGVDGLHRFKSEGHYDIVITDLEMPRMRGEELVAALKAGWPCTVVIAVGGEPTLEAARSLLVAGCECLLPKLSLDVSEVVKAMEAGRERQRRFQRAAVEPLLEHARRAVVAEMREPVEELGRHLTALVGGKPAPEERARLGAKSLELVRRLHEAMQAIERATGNGDAAGKSRAAEDAPGYGGKE